MSLAQAKDLIQAKALGCLDEEEEKLFAKLLEEDDFPWQELGQYQNLVAFLPTLLDIENPDKEVKDNIARKLYEYGEKIKVEEETENVAESENQLEDSLNEIKEEGVVIEEEPDIIPPGVAVEENYQEDVQPIKKGISFKDHGVLQGPLSKPEGLAKKPPVTQLNKSEQPPLSGLPKKETDKRRVKSYVSKIPPVIEQPEEKSNKMNILAIIISVIALLLMLVLYFMMSADIRENQNEIQKLKNQIHSEVLFDSKSNISDQS